jgi:hypothetical protein
MVTSVMVVPRWPQSYQSGGQHEGLPIQPGQLFRGQLQRDLAEAAPDHHLEDVAVLERLGAAGAARELDHGLVAVEERQARQLAPVAVTVEETNVPAFAMGKRHKDAVLAPQGIGVQVPSSAPIQKINKIREGQPETVGLLFRYCSCFCSGCRKVGDVNDTEGWQYPAYQPGAWRKYPSGQ